jgi:hypothetical protein
MEACISCEGMIDATTRRCSRCGRVQPESCAAESGSTSGERDDGRAEPWTWAAYSRRLLVPSAAGKITEPSAAAVMAETAARPVGQAAPAEESPGDGRRLIDIFRDRRIILKDPDLTPPLRLLIYAAFAQTVIVALLLLGGLKVSQPASSHRSAAVYKIRPVSPFSSPLRCSSSWLSRSQLATAWCLPARFECASQRACRSSPQRLSPCQSYPSLRCTPVRPLSRMNGCAGLSSVCWHCCGRGCRGASRRGTGRAAQGPSISRPVSASTARYSSA